MNFKVLALAVGSLYTGTLLAQTDSTIWKKQLSELKQTLADADKKLEERQKLYLDAQNKKSKVRYRWPCAVPL